MQSYPDPFIADSLPPEEDWPDFVNVPPGLESAPLNAATELLDEAVCTGYGAKAAILTDGTSWTYSEILNAANRLTNFLRKEGNLIPGNRVLIRGGNTPWTVICWFAVLKAGGIAVLTMPLLRATELNAILECASVNMILCDNTLGDELEAVGPFRPCWFFGPGGDLENAIAAQSADCVNYPAKPGDIALIAFTSGTTGTPKGALHSHRDILSVCKTYADHCLRPKTDDILIGTPPLAFAYGMGALLFFPFYARATVAFPRDTSRQSLTKTIRKHRATILFAVPTAYKALLRDVSQYDLSSLRLCVSAGEILSEQVAKEWQKTTGIRLMDGIGSTEMLHSFICAAEDTPAGALGRPVPGYEAAILDEEGEEAETGSPGRLAVRGPTGCRYLNEPRQADYVQNGWNITGDLAERDASGTIWFKTRADGMIVSAGYNIAGPDVEQTLLQHNAVAECAVTGTPDPERGKIVTAFVVLKEGIAPSGNLVETLQDFAKETAAPYKYPRKIHFIDSLPRTHSGKVQYFKLPQPTEK